MSDSVLAVMADTTIDLVERLRKKECEEQIQGCAVAEINSSLPFMYGDAIGDPSMFDAVLENPSIETRLLPYQGSCKHC